MNKGQDAIFSINNIYEKLYNKEKKVADYILKNPQIVAGMTVTELAEASKTSEATIMRLSKKAGFRGFYHLKIALTQTFDQEENYSKKEVDYTENLKENIEKIMENKKSDLEKTFQGLDLKQVKQALKLIKSSNTLYIYAAGNTNNIANYSSYLFNQIGIKAISSPLPEMQINFAYQMKSDDLCLLISASGSTTLTNNVAKVAQDAHVPCIVITEESRAPLSQLADVLLLSSHQRTTSIQLVTATQLMEMAIIDLLITLLTTVENVKYAKYGINQEQRLAEYKK